MRPVTKESEPLPLKRGVDRLTGINQFLGWLEQLSISPSGFEQIAANILSQVIEKHIYELLNSPDLLPVLVAKSLREMQKKPPYEALDIMNRLIEASEKYF
ncbi:MAG: hypothetical protein ACFFDI_19885 [Promethearchaeota archaeon]